MPRVNPEILRWARETAGLTPEEAVAKLHLGGAKGLSPEERLLALENGDLEPTRPQLVNMAKQYRRPLLTFYRAIPPRVVKRGTDFRTLPEPPAERDEALVDALVRDVRARQSMIRAALEEEGEATPYPYVGTADQTAGTDALVQSIRSVVKISADEFRRARNEDDAFALLRERVEAAGVYVLLIGNLGSWHTAIDIELFRGFAIADPLAPLIVINDQDSKAAWSFTLVHELAHIWLGQTGISGGAPDRELEQFCNDVASEFLLPGAELATQNWTGLAGDALLNAVTSFARSRNVSSSMIAYKLFRTGRIKRAEWQTLRATYRRMWLDAKRSEKDVRDDDAGGPTYYVLKRHRLGTRLVAFTARMLNEGVLTTTKAAQVLGVNPRNVDPLISGLRQKSA